ncbi:MAG: hypothetical protein AMXMBFR84_40840 [Candidatus Hydrogenedentota bacterium]
MKTALAFLTALIVVSAAAVACSHNYISYLFTGGDYYAKLMLPTLFSIECNVILGKPLVVDSNNDSNRVWTEAELRALYERPSDPYDITLQAEIADLAELLKDQPNAEAVLADHNLVRTAITGHFKEWKRLYADVLDNPYRSVNELAPPEPMDITPFEDRLATLPPEFDHYLRGAAAYHGQQWDKAIEQFSAILALPEDQRVYRSTWAAFMLGKTWTRKDASRAGPYFEQTQSLAKEGFRDSLGLAEASPGWHARAEMEAGNYVEAIKRYAALTQNPSVNIGRVCERALSQDEVDPRLVEDATTRKLISAWLTAHKGANADRWLAAVEAALPDGTVEEADYLAMISYNKGDFDAARRWLNHCPPDKPYAKWIRAKLLLHDGKFDEAAQWLEQTAALMEDDSRWQSDIPSDGELTVYGATRAKDFARADLGYVYTRMGNYAGAAKAFIEAHDHIDAVRVTESVMTTEELQEFVDSYQAPKVSSPDDEGRGFAFGSWGSFSGVDLKSILARRYARAGEWNKAAQLYPEEMNSNADAYGQWSLSPHHVLSEMHTWANTGIDPSQSGRVRAEAWFNFAKTIREKGPAIFCPNLIPENWESSKDVEGFQPDYDDRIRNHMAEYPRMNYFVWFAADHMWKSAELCPNNDLLCAEALFTGGTYIKYKDPQAADKFYKALVRRNPNLRIAIQADGLRWFPEEFTDEVVYQPLPRQWYGRRRNLAIGGGLLSLLLVVMGAARWYATKKRITVNGKPGAGPA